MKRDEMIAQLTAIANGEAPTKTRKRAPKKPTPKPVNKMLLHRPGDEPENGGGIAR